LNIGTWNIKGISTKKDQVFDQLERYGMDIVALTETKKKGTGNEKD
jgi:exonuclease III